MDRAPDNTPVYGVNIYDAKHGAWDRLPPLLDFANGLPLFCQCVAVGSSVVMLGGWDPASWAVLKCVYVYNFSSGQWKRGSDMPSVRSFYACGGLDGKIIVAGGHDDNKNALRSAEMYDVENDVWEPLPDMGQERDECKAAVISGKFIVISGLSQGQFGSRTAESFDVINRTWEIIDNMWPAGKPPCAVVAMKGQLYALLGGKLMRYNCKEEQWEAMVSTPQEIIRVTACATTVGDDGILVSGYSSGVRPFEAFICRLASGSSNAACWERVDGFPGLVHAACTVEV